MKPRRAVCLLSGGLDSAVVGTIAKCERYELYCLTVDYGQRHVKELEHAAKVAQALRAKEHKILTVPLAAFGGSALTQGDIPVPKDRSDAAMAEGIPATYVPARNTVLLALAMAYAETVGADAIFIGAHAVDYSGYPDCRPEFIEAFQALAKVATKRAVEGKPPRIFAPLLAWDKVHILETGFDLRAPIQATWSCYEDGTAQCGRCDACRIRRRAFDALGREDPVGYAPTGKTPAPPAGKPPPKGKGAAKPPGATRPSRTAKKKAPTRRRR